MSDMVSDRTGVSMLSKNEGYTMMGMHQLPVLSRPQRLRESVSTQKNGSDNPKKLLLTLPPDRIPENDCSTIRSLFLYLDSTVRVKPKADEKGKYTIVFKDTNAARMALLIFRNKGYNIRRQFLSRPSPKNPVKFIVMASQLLVQEGKALTSSVVGKVMHSQTVVVNQWKQTFAKKGKVLRARIMKPSEDGEHWENWGWVSRFSEDGDTPLVQRAELQEIR